MDNLRELGYEIYDKTYTLFYKMKISYFIIATLLLVSACNTGTAKVETEINKATHEKDEFEKKDTTTRNLFFSREYIEKEEYQELIKNSVNEILIFPKTLFTQNNKGLTITLQTGKSLTFINDDGEIGESDIKVYTYQGYSQNHDIHIYSIKLYESTEFYAVNDKTGQTVQLEGMPSFQQNGNFIFCTSSYLGIDNMPNGIYLYSIENGHIKLEKEVNISDWTPDIQAFWIDEISLALEINFPYKEGEEASRRYGIIKILEFDNHKNVQQINNDWCDIFYFYPFEEGSTIRGNYYVQIEKEGLSDFATSFGNRDVKFSHKVTPFLDNDTLYLTKENSPEVLAKIVKVGNNYYINSPLIKVYSEDTIPTQYGYKQEKGFPED